MRLIEKVWFKQHAAKYWMVPLLLPLTLLFWLISLIRRTAYYLNLKKSIKRKIPIVVVGNIGVGGNGKTPVVLWLVEQLQKQGLRVGVISRGYGAKAPYYPFLVKADSLASQVGDEPLMIYQRCHVPVAIGSDRIASIQALEKLNVQIVISDDGLQHYKMARDFELIVVDGNRLFGNGMLLPAGPLRESTDRLNDVDCIIVNGSAKLNTKTAQYNMQLIASQVINVKTGESIPLSDFEQVHSAVNTCAGIGDPDRFFSYVESLGFTIDKAKAFVDHQAYLPQHFEEFCNTTPLLMTEKDAVKCTGFAKENWWFLPVDARFTKDFQQQIISQLVTLTAFE